MPSTSIVTFGPFRLDLGAERLWRGEEAIPLSPKTFAVLCYLVEHVGQLVTRQAVIEAVWGTQEVSDAALASCIRDIRRAFGDQAQTPQWLETVRGRGFRFVDRLTPPVPESAPYPQATGSRPPLVVGRDDELAHLQRCAETALRGERQIVFLTGEPGIGKTTLVETLLATLPTQPQSWWITGGQCIEHYGAAEAYMPVLEALSRLGQEPDQADLVAVLAQYAPTWLAQLPALVSVPEREALLRTLQGATPARMLREFADALEMLTTRRPLLLVLEDLHWSDYSTVELLAYIAQRRRLARLLVLGTYRPVEVLTRAHPLHGAVQELHVKGYCQEVRLGLLQDTAVETYVRRRLVAAHHDPPVRHVATAIHQRTGGNPLFMVTLFEHLLRERVIVEAPGQWCVPPEVMASHVGLPESLRQLIEKQFASLPAAEQQLLEVASVAGHEFAVAAVAAGVDQSVEDVEARCAAWAHRGQFVRSCGTDSWPDGTVAARYGFIHALYRDTLYDRLPLSTRVRLHRQIGARLAAGYGAQARDMAAALAEHFVQGQDAALAVQYLQYAGEQALRRNAHQEAISQLSKALTLLHTLPDTPERVRYELDIQTVLGSALIATRGYATPEVAQTYNRLRTLSEQAQDRPRLFLALRGLWNCYLMRTEVQMARTLGEQLFQLATQAATPALLVEARRVLGTTLFFQGELLAARSHLEEGITLYDRQQHPTLAVHYGADPGVTCRVYAARTLWLLGYPAQALQRGHDALRLARDLGHPFSTGFALSFLTDLLLLRRQGAAAQTHNEAVLALAHDHGFPHWVATGMINRGWCLIEQGQWEAGCTQMLQGTDVWQATGSALEKPLSLAILAAAYGKVGRIEAGLACLAEAHTLVQQTGERWWEAELHRLQGELLLQQATPDVEHGATCFQQALAVARQQQARSLELRAAMSLSRLWQQQGRRQEACQLLEEAYGWFTEGFDTQDLQEAEALLRALGGRVAHPSAPPPRTHLVDERPAVSPAAMTSATPPDLPPLPAVPTPVAAEATAMPDYLFRHEGEYWTIVFQGTICRIKDTYGVRYIVQLLRSPQCQIHALTLINGSHHAATTDASAAMPTRAVSEPNPGGTTPLGVFTDAGDMLDPQARAAYRQRLLALQAELEEARAWNDPGRSARLQQEIDFLTQELRRAVGLGGRSRKAASPAERARVNVTRAIKTTLQRLTAVHPALGTYLTQTIKTGTSCSYTPDPQRSLPWQF